jgi:hypothetical protein
VRTIRFRLTGPRGKADAMIADLHEIDAVDRVEEVADQMHTRDDTSSLNLPDDDGVDFHDIEVHAQSSHAAEDVRGRIEILAHRLGVAVELVDEF